MECITCITEYPEEDFIKCLMCNYSTCGKCFKYGITQDIKDPVCLNCKKLINIEFILENSETEWLYESFLPHLGKILVEKEKALLPYTQEEVSKILKIKDIQRQIRNLPSDKKLKSMFSGEVYLIEKNKKDLEKMSLRNKISNYNQKEKKSKVIELIAKCCVKNCKGYINKNFICGTCEVKVCSGCFVEEKENHKCKTEDLQLRDLLKTHSKPCPQCYIPIIKAGGCDQMWCTNCNTAFSWNNGTIETGVVHNPHYYEWLSNSAEQVPNLENIACGELPRMRDILTILRQKNAHYKTVEKIQKVHRLRVHTEHVIIPRDLAEDRVKDNIDLRVKFLLDEITEKQWINTLLNRERKRMKNRAYRQVLQLFITVITDLFRRLIVEKNIAILEKEIVNFNAYLLSCFERVYMLHGGYHPSFLNDFFN